MQLAWGAKVTSEFADKVVRVSERLECDPDHLMACMAFETGRTFSPSVRNPSSTATGLIQFMAATAKGLGTTVGDLAQMTAIEQLDYVEAYFKPYAGQLNSLADVYAAIIWPAAVGRPDDYVLFREGEPAYAVNKGLDLDKRGTVTKIEAAAKVAKLLEEGLRPGNIAYVGEQPAAPIVEAGRPYNPEQAAPELFGNTEQLAEPPEQPIERTAFADIPTPIAPTKEARMPIPSILGVILPSIVQAIPGLITIFGKGERAEQNAKAAQIVADTVVQATESVNLQQAAEKIQNDPTMRDAAAAAINANPILAQMMQLDMGGVESARKANVAPDQPPIWRNPAMIVTAMVMPTVYYVLIAVLEGHAKVSDDVRAGVIMSVISGVLGSVMGYWLGTSFGSARKTDIIAGEKR